MNKFFLLILFLVTSPFISAQKLLIHQELEKWGFIDSKTFNKLDSFEYDFLTPINEDMYLATKKDTFYILNQDKIIYSDSFDRKKHFYYNRFYFENYIHKYREGLAVIYKDNLAGFLDKDGNWAIPPKYSFAKPFEDGYAIVLENNIYKLINKKAQEIKIDKPNIQALDIFRDDLALFSNILVNENTKIGNYYFVNKNAKIQIDVKKQFEANYASSFNNRLAIIGRINQNDDWDKNFFGIIDTKGNLILPIKYHKIDFLANNKILALWNLDKKLALYDLSGKAITNFIYEDYQDLGEKRIAVKKTKDETWEMIDLQGKTIPTVQEYQEFFPFQNGKAMVKIHHGYATFIDKNGKELVSADNITHPAQWYRDYEHSDSQLYSFEINGKFGLNTENVWRFFPEYEDYKRFYKIENTKDLLIPVKKNGKWGYIDKEGNIKIDFKYDDVLHFHSTTYTGVKKGNKWGFISKNGIEIGSFEYDLIKYDTQIGHTILNKSKESGFYQVRKNGKWGLVNHTGETIIPCKYDLPFSFEENKTSLAKKNKQWGVINYQNQIIIPFEYDKIEKYNSDNFRANIPDHYRVKKNGKWGIIDTTNNILIDFQYDNISYSALHDTNFLEVKNNDKIGLIDFQTKRLVIPIEYDEIYIYFFNKVVGVYQNGKWGYFDIATEKNFIPCEYDSLIYSGYDYSIIIAQKSKKYGLINRQNKILLDFEYDSLDVQYRDNGIHLLAMKENSWGAYDKGGKMRVSLDYNEIGWLFLDNDRLIGVQKNGKWGFIDQKGKIIIPFKYEDAIAFTKVKMKNKKFKYFALVKENQKWGLIDDKGKFIIKPRYEDVSDYHFSFEIKYDTRIWARLDGKTIYFDILGNEYDEE